MATKLKGLLQDGGRTIASNAAVTLLPSDRMVGLAASTASAKSIGVAEVANGQAISIQLLAASGGSYTIAATNLAGSAGTVTLDAAGEGVDLYKEEGTLRVFRLIGTATFA